VPGTPHSTNINAVGDVKKDVNDHMTNNGTYSGSLKAFPEESSEKSLFDKKQWPELAQVIRNGNKSSKEQEIDRKLVQNKVMNRPVFLNIGGTKYEVCSFFSEYM
jgi:hypothetical protein